MMPIDPFFHIGFGRPSEVARDQVISKKSDSLDACLERKDFVTIIENKDLFWLAFCKALFPNQGKKDSDVFRVSIEGNVIKIFGREHVIKQTQDLIEEMRQFFLEGLRARNNFEFLAIEFCMDFYLIKASDCIDITNQEKYFLWVYNSYLKPALPQLAKFCGALYSEYKKNQTIKFVRECPPEKEIVDVIRIQWRDESHLIYPIAPTVIPTREEFGKAMYSLYQKQEGCDFKLFSKDGVTKVHSVLLRIYGGPVLQALLSSDMKETNEASISFEGYSKSVVDAFMDYIYLGGEAFSEKVLSSHEDNKINIIELFEFAHTYQVDTLVDCCTNIISLVATKNDLETLQSVLALHDNKHLKQICDHLATKDNTSMIKV